MSCVHVCTIARACDVDIMSHAHVCSVKSPTMPPMMMMSKPTGRIMRRRRWKQRISKDPDIAPYRILISCWVSDDRMQMMSWMGMQQNQECALALIGCACMLVSCASPHSCHRRMATTRLPHASSTTSTWSSVPPHRQRSSLPS